MFFCCIICVMAVVASAPLRLRAETYAVSDYNVRVNCDPWEEIQGDPVSSLDGDYFERVSDEIQLPFQFQYINLVTDKIKVMGDGSVIFGGSLSWPDEALYDFGNFLSSSIELCQSFDFSRNAGFDANMKASPWYGGGFVGLEPIPYPSGRISTAVLGTAPHRQFVVQSLNMAVRHPDAASIVGSWQVVLEEGGVSTLYFKYGPQTGAGSWGQRDNSNPIVIGLKGDACNDRNHFITIDASSNPGCDLAPNVAINSIIDNQFDSLPTWNFRFFLNYNTEIALLANTLPADQSFKHINETITPTTRIRNVSRLPVNSVTLERQITIKGESAPFYTSIKTISGAQIPPEFGEGEVSFDPMTLTKIGLYEDTTIIISSDPIDDYPSDNMITSEFEVNSQHNARPRAVITPQPETPLPVNVSVPVEATFANVGFFDETNVPVSVVIKDPTGVVVYRDTVIFSNLKRDTTYSISFAEWTPTIVGNHTACAISLLPGDGLRADDTVCTTIPVRYQDDIAAVGSVNPQPGEEKPYTLSFKPSGLFRNVGVADLFDVRARVEIRHCSDGELAFAADSTVPELNINAGGVRFNFPSQQGIYDIAAITPGCYTMCIIAKYRVMPIARTIQRAASSPSSIACMARSKSA